ncbi:MAG TPA: hypothetical protein VI893_10860 [Thermoplasmata archaeon]|nr:hypothetical protein [Thermoplasmata archaeon]
MRRLVAWAIVIAALVGVVAVAGADRSLRSSITTRTPIRGYSGATPLQYDTLAVSSGERVELQNFSVFADDSAQTPTLWVSFVSSVSKTPYLRLQQAYTANQALVTTWTGPWVFPADSTILVYYNLLGATPGTLDTLMAHATYRLERP